MQYRIRYIEGKKAPPPGAILAGQSVHKSLETDLGQKIKSKENMKTNDVLEIFSDSFEKLCKETKNTTGEAPEFKTEEKGEMKDKTVRGLELYHKVEAKIISPVAVEKKFEINFKNVDWKVIGSIDVIHEELEKFLIDFKRVGRYTKPEIAPDQLKMYSVAESGIKTRLDSINCITQPEIYKDPFMIPPAVLENYLKEVSNIVIAIKASLFYPNPGFNNMNCGMCGFKDRGWCELWR